MNPIDVVVLVILGAFALFGLRRGFLHGVLDLVIVALTLLAASRIYPLVVEPAVARGLPRSIASPVAFIGLFGILVFLVSGLVGLLLRPFARMWFPAPARWADTVLGVVPGAIKGLALATVVVVPLIFYQGLFGLGGAVAQSRLAAPLLQWGLPAVYGALGRLGVDTTDFAAVTSPPSEGTIALPFRITDGLAPDPAGEQQMLQLVNQARADAGLQPLRLDPALTEVARAHSTEMFALGYFSHDSPDAGSPSDRLTAAGIPFLAMGENIALAPSVETAHRNLMNSPGHRANILDPAFTRVGIGIIAAPGAGLMVSQEFAT